MDQKTSQLCTEFVEVLEKLASLVANSKTPARLKESDYLILAAAIVATAGKQEVTLING